MTESQDKPASRAPAEDLDAAREFLSRARRFLERARQDPEGAVLEGESPERLTRDLTNAMDVVQSAGDAPPAEEADPAEESAGTIRRLHRRRSA
jgi:hypothetical protein